jgi:hypothetical protein
MVSLSFTQNLTAEGHLAQTFVFAFPARLVVTAVTHGSTAQQHEEGSCFQLVRVEVKRQSLVKLGTLCSVFESRFLPFNSSTSGRVQLDDTHVGIWKTSPQANVFVVS